MGQKIKYKIGRIAYGIYSAIDEGIKKWIETYGVELGASDAKNKTLFEISECVSNEVEKIVDELTELEFDRDEYRKRCSLIVDIGFDYDGTNTESATAMKELVDELVGFARDGVSSSIGNSGIIRYPRYVSLDVDEDKLIRTLNKQIHRITSTFSGSNDELIDRYIEMKKRAEEAEMKLAMLAN